MSVRKWLFPLALAGLATASVALAAPQLGRPAVTDASRQATLTPQDEAAVQQLKDLWKQARIARLELRLAEAKGAPESEVAAKQKAVEEARGRMRQWRADHPELAQQLRQGLRSGRGMGARGGRGGLGMQHRRGMGGDGQGVRGGRGLRGMMGGGRGEGMRLRQRDPSQCPYVQSAPAAQPEAPAPQPEEPQQQTQPEQ